jgi:hypothetical protein
VRTHTIQVDNAVLCAQLMRAINTGGDTRCVQVLENVMLRDVTSDGTAQALITAMTEPMVLAERLAKQAAVSTVLYASAKPNAKPKPIPTGANESPVPADKVCLSFAETGACPRAELCRFNHVRLSKQEALKLRTYVTEAQAVLKARNAGKGAGRGGKGGGRGRGGRGRGGVTRETVNLAMKQVGINPEPDTTTPDDDDDESENETGSGVAVALQQMKAEGMNDQSIRDFTRFLIMAQGSGQ